MTIDRSGSDPELKDHPSVEIRGTIHALQSDSTTKDRPTECGLWGSSESTIKKREGFDTDAMCPVCWPDIP